VHSADTAISHPPLSSPPEPSALTTQLLGFKEGADCVQFQIRVAYGDTTWFVHHRFKHFVQLRASLGRRSLGKKATAATLPGLPSKMWRFFEPKQVFLARRTAELGAFLQELVKQEHSGHHKALLSFLQFPGHVASGKRGIGCEGRE
jgi:hypothetical protein